MAEEQLVVFRLGKEDYAVPISHVREIVQYSGAKTKLPHVPAYMDGIINLRGKIIPVIDLAMMFGINADRGSDRRALIIEVAALEVALAVDEVSDVVTLQDTSIELPTSVASGQHIRGIGKDGNRLLILLDVENLFNQNDISNLKKCC